MSFRRGLIVLVATLVGVVVVSNFPMREDRIWIDPVSGSMKYQTRWLFFGMAPRVEHSAIERWIVAHEGSYDPGWRSLSVGWRTIFGKIFGRGCSIAPEVYPLHHREFNAGFVRVASNAEVAEFVRIMRMGTASEKEQAVASACQKVQDGTSAKETRADAHRPLTTSPGG